MRAAPGRARRLATPSAVDQSLSVGVTLERDHLGVVLGIEAAQQQDRVAEARLPQSARFADARNRRATRTCLDRRLRHCRGAHAIGLSFDDGGNTLARLRRGLQRADVVGDGIQVNLDPAQHRSIVKRP